MSLSTIAVKYSLAGPRAALPDKPSAPGHPPRHTSAQTSSSSRALFAPVISSPEKTACIETSPVDSPLSQRLIGRIVSLAMRPVPVCRGMRSPSPSSTSGGTALPVKTNIPLPPLSTAERTASHNCGPSCHSSISRGIAPSSNLSGRVCARRRLDFPFTESSKETSLFTAWREVVVFPHHLGPCTKTAPI